MCCVFQLEATAVHWACRGGSLPALQLLMDQGAKVTYRDKVSTHKHRFFIYLQLYTHSIYVCWMNGEN